MLQALIRCVGDETLADQAPELLLDILHSSGMRLERWKLFLHRLPLAQHESDQAANFLR